MKKELSHSERLMKKADKTLAVRLMKQLHKLGHFLNTSPYEVRIQRTYAGYHERDGGAFSWYAVNLKGMEIHLGSVYSLSSLIKYKDCWYVYIPRNSLDSITLHFDGEKIKEKYGNPCFSRKN